jgi:glycosyltransferase involved in cell wall biosynthesis
MSQPRITVGLPTYNSTRYLAETLAAIQAQTFEDFEWVVSDDRSSDETVAMVRELGDPRIRLLTHDQGLGLVGNWNACVAAARAPYTVICNHDDLWHPAFLARAMQVLDAQPEIGLVFSDIRYIDAEGQPVGGHWSPQALPQGDMVWPQGRFFDHLLAHGNIVSGSAAVFRSDLAQALGGFDPRVYYTLDLLLWLRLALRAPVAYLDQPLCRLRWHPEQITSRYAGSYREIDESWLTQAIVFGEDRPPRSASRLACGTTCAGPAG